MSKSRNNTMNTQDKDTTLDEILHDLAISEAAEEAWVDAKQALLNWRDKAVVEAEKQGFYAGQANAGVSLEQCRTNYRKWSEETPDED